MAEPAPEITADALQRRSTRIIRAVPLTVTGVDALGRSFEERTSTSIVSCHGGRYQSRHYVTRREWVTLEVQLPCPEFGCTRRRVRGRILWIQRPRAVRELFQFGVELEVRGNFWGITCCPPDWFPFPDDAEPAARTVEGRTSQLEPCTTLGSESSSDAPPSL